MYKNYSENRYQFIVETKFHTCDELKRKQNYDGLNRKQNCGELKNKHNTMHLMSQMKSKHTVHTCN